MQVGARLGAYEVIAKLGEGGMGQAFAPATRSSIATQLPIRRHVEPHGRSFPGTARRCGTFVGTRAGGSTRGQLNVVPVAMNPLTIGTAAVVLAEDPANGISFTSFDVAEDGRLLMTRRADPQPGDEGAWS